MPIKIYNSLTRDKVPFEPINPPKVKMYVCGPTVYDESHIGHARSAYIFDVIRRYLEYKNYRVNFVRNVTDVDDKIIDKARKEFPDEEINSAVKKVSEKYLASYHKDMEILGIKAPTHEPKATEYIKKMIGFIEGLIERGAAYSSGGDVYFDIKKARSYGKLSNQSPEMMKSGARVHPGENKKDPLDFALWKSAKEGEPSWDSPWGKGRPGWHIECSVMSSDILGDEFDIHGGGIDLIFPHHENEIAQSEGAGKKFAKIWIHNGLLTINKEKMAKSLGNFITIKKFIEGHKDLDYLKLLFLGTHYSHPVDYSEEKIKEIEKSKERIDIFIRNVNNLSKEYGNTYKKTQHSIDPDEDKGGVLNDIKEFKIKFEQAMDDDFNTPLALSELFSLIHYSYSLKMNFKSQEQDDLIYQKLNYAKSLIIELTKSIFALNFFKEDKLSPDEEKLIEDRNLYREKKDYKMADEIRKVLVSIGIIPEDTKDGKTTWRRKI